MFGSATPTAKSELKKEMEKMSVRKQTADAILAQVLGGAVEVESPTEARPVVGAEEPTTLRDGDQPGRKLTARSASRTGQTETADDGVAAVYSATQWDVDRIMASFLPFFEGKETEHNWLAREQSIVKLRGMLRTETHDRFPDAFLSGLKQVQEGILKATASLRTTLSMHALQLISELAQKMQEGLDSMAEPLLASIIRMAGFTKKIVASASQTAVHDILVHVSYRHKFLDMIWQNVQEKMVTTRAFMCGHLITILDTHGLHRRHAIEGHGGLEIIERICKKALPDQNKDVREKAREAFYKVEKIWPSLASQILDNLDAATRKQVMSNRAKPVTGSSASGLAAAPAARRSAGPGPSSAILAAKKAAAARLAQDRRNQDEMEAAAQVQDDLSSAGPSPLRADEARWRQQEAAMDAEADSSSQLLDEREDGGESEQGDAGTLVEQTPIKPAAHSFPPVPAPKSPLRSPLRSPFMNGRGHARTPSSIPLPVSPLSGSRVTPQLQDESSPTPSKASLVASSSPLPVHASRSRTTSTSSSSSMRSTARLGSSEASHAAGRYESFGQRVGQVASGLPTPTRIRTISSSSSSLREKLSAASPSSLRGRDVAATTSSPRMRHLSGSQELDETVELDQIPDASVDLMSSTADMDLQGVTSSLPMAMPRESFGEGNGDSTTRRLPSPQSALQGKLTLAKTPSAPSSASIERSRLPRPVSVMYSGASPIHLETSKHKQSRSIDVAQHALPLPVKAAAAPTLPHGVVHEEAGDEERKAASSSRVKWFLAKASRLDHDDFGRGTDIDVHLSPVKKRPESEEYVAQLQNGQADLRTFKALAGICKEFKLPERSAEEENSEEDVVLQPGKLLARSVLGLEHVDQSRREQEIAVTMWQQGSLFERLFAGLSTFLTMEAGTNSKDLKTAGMIVLHRLVENQFRLFEVLGKERELIELVFDLVKTSKAMNVKSACQAILESWSDQTNVVVGISMLRGILTKHLVDAPHLSTPSGTATPDSTSSATIAVHTLSLRCLSRLFQRLPVELVEEEVQRCRVSLQRGLNHWNIETRQQAVAVLVAANGKVHDPRSLFTILQPMERAQEDLLMYYMSKT